MVYTRTWDAAYEADPADSDNVSEGADQIRDLKIDIRERLAKDHYMSIAGTDADHGEHEAVTLRVQSSAPANAANKGKLYTKSANSIVELFYKDDANGETQLTANGAGTFIEKSVLLANSIIIANSANTPVNLAVAVNRVVGRLAGSIQTLDAANVRTLINVANGSTNGAPFGAWDGSKVVNTVYLAATDGLVVATIITAGYGAAAYMYGYSYVDNPPTLLVARMQLEYRSPTATMTFPVPKGYYWKVTFSGSAAGTTVYWMPIGA